MQKHITKIILIIFIGIFASFIAANRDDSSKARNDTAAYASHHYCISEQRPPEQCRKEIGSNQVEFFYELFIKNITNELNINNFYYIKLLTAITIYCLVLVSVGITSKNSFISILILLLDFRFWEYGTNVLRHGFAAAFISLSIALLFNNKSNLSVLSKLLAIASHLSAASIFVTPCKKYRFSTILFLLAITGLIFLTSNQWIPAILESNLFEYKIDYYLRNSDGYNFALPFHYSLFIFSGLLLYTRSQSRLLITTINYLIPLFLTSIILGHLDASYRMTSFMLPIIAINIPEQISIFSKNFRQEKTANLITSSAIILLMGSIAARNWEFFLVHTQ